MGTAFVVYDDIYDAKTACDHLSGYNLGGRYLVVLYHQPQKQAKKLDLLKKKQEMELMKQKFGIESRFLAPTNNLKVHNLSKFKIFASYLIDNTLLFLIPKFYTMQINFLKNQYLLNEVG
ncbi:RNA recognition motif-containing protein RRM [Cavenderia fasciculata]|uniref:RNA recognition motif-containing protein RRM n=1 Tax=Cavenderia fasciculata TaxID=261658 RepID=F4PNG6_CACFS|nr:RNA recognition motif-containing protein RRM [Cavenderia fasciculata]EGG23019.1 RNA recognition motif-containing protein RRM [Cavenderia fasciculata]|eukprot:XP_004360870.1 RNA recognition motif-containing protein RRM [Cavenderia fasciculata]